MGQYQSTPAITVPPSNLPVGWVSWFDARTQSLQYTNEKTPNDSTQDHPLGPKANQEELSRFYAIRYKIDSMFHSAIGYQPSQFISLYNQQGGLSQSSRIVTKGRRLATEIGLSPMKIGKTADGWIIPGNLLDSAFFESIPQEGVKLERYDFTGAPKKKREDAFGRGLTGGDSLSVTFASECIIL